MNRIYDRMTPGRLRWLDQLEREGIASRWRGPTGYQCWHLGWTDWAVRTSDGSIVGRRTVEGPLPDGWEYAGEMLTAAGRAALEKARAARA